MSDPEVLDRILQTCSFRSRDVLCPNQDRIASITAAKFHVEDEDWSVLECSREILLAPPNQVERRSMSLFTGMAILEERFATAYFEVLLSVLTKHIKSTVNSPHLMF